MQIDNIKTEKLKTDFLIIGAGTAGCLAAYEAFCFSFTEMG